jgi:hypothetical protein
LFNKNTNHFGKNLDVPMQLVCEYHGAVKDYLAADGEVFNKPESCGNCGKVGGLHWHGDYMRGISACDSDKIEEIPIKRLRCSHCRLTMSLLPSFAQPRHCVHNQRIETYFACKVANNTRYDGSGRSELLESYWRRINLRWSLCCLPNSRHGKGRPPPSINAVRCWELLTSWRKTLSITTVFLVKEFGITPFGVYHFHWPRLRGKLFPTRQKYFLRCQNGEALVLTYEGTGKQRIASRSSGNGKNFTRATAERTE